MKIIGLIFQEHLLVDNRAITFIALLLCMVFNLTIKGQDINEKMTYDSISNMYVYTFVEKMPQYMGGEIKFLHDFISVFNYTIKGKDNIQTFVKVQFIINKKGKLIYPRIFNKKDYELTDFEIEILKALKKTRKWKAGKHHNKKVNVFINKIIRVDLKH